MHVMPHPSPTLSAFSKPNLSKFQPYENINIATEKKVDRKISKMSGIKNIFTEINTFLVSFVLCAGPH